MDQIAIFKMQNASEYLHQIDKNEADAEFVCAVTENDEGVYAVLYRETAVGLALLEEGPNAFLYVYIFPPYRHRGFGKAAVLLLERELGLRNGVTHNGDIHDSAIQGDNIQDGAPHNCVIQGLTDISTCYRSDDSIACLFAGRCGYEKEFASDYMVYSGPRFEAAEMPVRQYQDKDYLEAQSLSAEAFHRMRLGTGCFPDSAPEPPDEEERKYWADTAAERFVYMDGDEIIGYAHIQGNEISSVSVKPGCQGKGVGKGFLKCLANILIDAGYTSISLYCVVGNDCARRLYDALGFVQEYRNAYAKKKVK